MKALVTMGVNNGVVIDNLRYRYNINAGWIPGKGVAFSIRAIVSIAINNLYFFRDDSIANKTFLCFSKSDIIHKAIKDKRLRQYAAWAWNECLKNKWFIRIIDDRYTFGENTNIEFISKC